jgi:molecular chaperone GrpE (heat shock protein)
MSVEEIPRYTREELEKMSPEHLEEHCMAIVAARWKREQKHQRERNAHYRTAKEKSEELAKKSETLSQELTYAKAKLDSIRMEAERMIGELTAIISFTREHITDLLEEAPNIESITREIQAAAHELEAICKEMEAIQRELEAAL